MNGEKKGDSYTPVHICEVAFEVQVDDGEEKKFVRAQA